jgi:hypothetical protein
MTDQTLRKEIKHREMMELMDTAAVFADRMYITPKRMAVTLSFCEDIPNAEENKVRARVAMTLESFMNFADMMTAVSKQIRDHQAKQQAEMDTENVSKGALN